MKEYEKLIMALVMVIITIGWGIFTVNTTLVAMKELKVVNVITVAGANDVLGALVVLLTLVYQHYFRKAKPE